VTGTLRTDLEALADLLDEGDTSSISTSLRVILDRHPEGENDVLLGRVVDMARTSIANREYLDPDEVLYLLAPTGRERTPDREHGGGTVIAVKRCCSACGRELGDARDDDFLENGFLSDTTGECGCKAWAVRQKGNAHA
jgi:hypothetical protein